MDGDQLVGQLIIRRMSWRAAVVAICSAIASEAAIGFSFMTWTPRMAALSITSAASRLLAQVTIAFGSATS